MEDIAKSKAICILGMHRSGTSSITRAINLLGAYLGEEQDLMAPAPDNPEGFWERIDIYNLQERLLAQVERTWDTALPLPDRWYLADELQPFREELKELIISNFSQHPLWAWKDPRSCVLFDMWKHLLDELGIELSCVFVARNPLDVANSLRKRNEFPIDRSLGIWFNYNITALRLLPGVQTVFMSYDRFLEDCEGELRKCAAGLGIEWPENDVELKELLRSFVRPDLRHSFSDVSALQTAPAPVTGLYALLAEALDHPAAVTSHFFEKVEQLYAVFYSYARFFQADLTALWERNRQVVELSRQQENFQRLMAERDKQLAERDQKLSELGQLIEQSQQQIVERDQQLAEREREIRERDLKITDLDQQLSERVKDIRERDRLLAEKERDISELSQRLAEMESTINALRGSYSWKVTSPLRWICSRILIPKQKDSRLDQK